MRIRLLTLVFFLPAAIFPQEQPVSVDPNTPAKSAFQMQLEKDDVLIVRKEQEILIGRSGAGRDERNRIVLKAVESDENGATMEGTFLTYFRMPAGRGAFQKDRDYHSRFRILKNGQYDVPDQYIMPNLRSLPSFPARPLSPGEVWEEPGMETIDLPGLKIKIPLQVRYKYVGPETVKDYYGKERRAHKIVFVYELNHKVVPGNGPVSIIQGRSTDEMWFSEEDGIPVYDVQTIIYRFTMKDRTERESAYRIKSWYEKIRRITPDEKKTMTADIKQEVEDAKNLTVRETDQGVVLDLNNILFDVDSDQLRPEALETLEAVKKILEKYPNREIRIQGHTDNTGGKKYNIDLSTRRAKSVLNRLVEQGLNGDRMSYKGFGETKPVAPNDTEEGRAQNRRVEILIVTE